MASFNIHLAVGKRYYEKNKSVIKIKKEFYKGIIAPDLVEDKKISHYTEKQSKNDVPDYLSKKVQLNKYLKSENIDTDYQKGVFLHLITDYLFFNYFFNMNYLKNISYENFCKDLYYSYDITDEYLENKYKIDYTEFSEQINKNIEKNKREKNTLDEMRTNILEFNKMDVFIEYVSNIDLENYKNKVIENNCNVLPDNIK